MADTVSIVQHEVIAHTQVSSTAVELEEVGFALADDEAVRLLSFDFMIQALSTTNDDALYAALFDIDDNPPARTVAAGQLGAGPITDDVIWSPRVVKDTITSGRENVNYEFHRDLPGDGILIAHDMNIGFISNNVGGVMGARVFYEVVRLDDRELVSLVARRRAR